MEESRQLLERFLEDNVSVVLGNPRIDDGRVEAAERALADSPYAKGHLLFGTSGTTSEPKWVGLSRQALEASAEAVVDHLEGDDLRSARWGLSLPCFHVGGAGILFRSRHASDDPPPEFEDNWDAQRFADWCRDEGLTHVSLVPAQVHDLVASEIVAPKSLCAILVGGGALSPELAAAGRALGWPLLATYGMSETASQVATQSPGEALSHDTVLPWILSPWEVRTDSDSGELEVRGAPLFSFYLRVSKEGHQWDRHDPADWFRTGDLVDLEDNGRLRWIGRADHVVKILGERVLLDQLRARFAKDAQNRTLAALPHDRRGVELVAVFEGQVDSTVVESFNEEVAPFERIHRAVAVQALPHTPLGKIDERNLRALAEKSPNQPE